MTKERIIVFDTTMRDGEQSPGASMDIHEKVSLGQQLERLNVDIIEAGFPASSPADHQAVAEVARAVRRVKIAALARALPGDIDAAADALQPARTARIHVFISTSALHIRRKLRMTEQDVLELTRAAVLRARNRCDDVQWSAEDCTRTDYDFMCRVFETAVKAGAKTVTIADTVGYATPSEIAHRIRHLREHVRGIDKVLVAIHCHNDLGMAVANSLAAVEAGAREVQCTVNGIGERAGNASLEEIVMAMRTRPTVYPFTVGVNTREILNTSRLVSGITGFLVQPNKAVVGANAFAHESGIHQDGVLKSALTYEIMTPQSVGAVSREIVIGRHSGRHGLKSKLAAMGLRLSEEETNQAFHRLKEVFSVKKHLSDEEIYQIVTQSNLESVGPSGPIHLEHLEYRYTEAGASVRAVVTVNGTRHELRGSGPRVVETIFEVLMNVSPIPVRLTGYSARNIGGGSDAMAQVTVQLEGNGRSAHGIYADVDLIIASTGAFLRGISHLLSRQQRWTWTLPARKPAKRKPKTRRKQEVHVA